MTNLDTQMLIDRLARRLSVARLALGMPTSPKVVAYHLRLVTDIAEQFAGLPARTALPPAQRVFGPATEALLAEVTTTAAVPDTVPVEWSRERRCPACGQVPDALARCRCS